MQDFEKLGVFYLGREVDLARGQPTDDLVLYDARDLVTHAVCVGMTGSGKTGLCIGLIEEAAIDGIPALLIDPKGDLTNLLLTFPGLSAGEFLPWVNPDDAARKGLSVEEYAQQQAETWRKGLAAWGQEGARIERLRNAAEFVIYTPGSSAGVGVSILKSFAAPGPAIVEDGELFQERIQTTVTSLLGLVGIQADPLQSREHILLSNIIAGLWRAGQDLDLATLIGHIQNPPFTKVGVLDLESFYPAKERFGLVIALNNLLASPGFAAWLEGQPLEIGELLYTPQGKPRVAIFSIAHLGDAERMFFVSLLLNQVLGWVRAQPGTTSLRALVYMDEIFGYFPPVANPPSKAPLLTLLKQARAYGVGVVLATQNPVDLDYKGLSNTGTWFIGRLQAERDKARVMDGLEGIAVASGGAFDRATMDKWISGLASRIFLMHNTHEERPVVFQTRWVLSYLRGPLTRTQIKQLMDPYKAALRVAAASAVPAAAPAAQPAATAAPAPAPVAAPSAPSAGSRPALPPEIPQVFIPFRGSTRGGPVTYRPLLLGAAKVRFADARLKADATQDVVALTPITDNVLPVDWEQTLDLGEGRGAGVVLSDLEKAPAEGTQFAPLPPAAGEARQYAAWSRAFATWLYASQTLSLWRSPSTREVSRPGESERDFRVRLSLAAREKRDRAVEALRQKYGPKRAALDEKIRRAQQAVEREEDQARQAGMQTAVSVGATLLTALTGRRAVRSTLGRATTAARGASRAAQQRADVARAKETLQVLQEQRAELEAQFEQELEALKAQIDPQTEVLEPISLRPKKTDIAVQLVALAWAPYRSDAQGFERPAW